MRPYRKFRLYTLSPFFLFLFILISAERAAAATAVTTCSLLDTQGEYILVNDLSGALSEAPACIVIVASDVTLDCNGFNITNNGSEGAGGIHATGLPASPLTNITVKNCAISEYFTGVTFQWTNNSTITNNNAYNNEGGGFFLSDTNSSSLRNNIAFSNLGLGFSLLGSSDNALVGNSASNNRHGFRLAGTSTGNSFENSSSSDNTFSGFLIFAGSLNSFTNNNVVSNGGAGFDISGGSFNSFTGNSVFNNTRGFFFSGGTAIYLVDNSIFSNTGSGVQVGQGSACCSSDIRLDGDHLYNNNPDLHVEIRASFGIPAIRLNRVIFDSPGGNFINDTELSMTDSIDGEPVPFAIYTIDWSPQPSAPLPDGLISFAGKFINITPLSGDSLIDSLISIDSITWHWLDSEPGDEGTFGIWNYNGAWTDMNAALDTAANTLSISELKPQGVFAILQSNPDEDFDGICDPGRASALCTGSDLCPGSVLDPIGKLSPNHYGQTVDFGAFEAGPNNDESLVYNQEVTKGCTCSQIADKLGAGEGNKKKGCDRDLLEQWTGVSAQPDWNAGIGRNPP